MSRILKYIIPEDPPSPILFSDCYTHQNMANGQKIFSAGFCTIEYANNKFQVQCFGESKSLNVKSETDDWVLLEMMLNDNRY